MKGIVDRIQGEVVVIEIEGKTEDVDRKLVAKDVREGDVVELQAGVWVKNLAETKKRAEKIKQLMDSVWND